jgi:hypothetical protein
MGKNVSAYASNWTHKTIGPEEIKNALDELVKAEKFMNELAAKLAREQAEFNAKMQNLPCSECGFIMRQVGYTVYMCEHQNECIKNANFRQLQTIENVFNSLAVRTVTITNTQSCGEDRKDPSEQPGQQ